MHNEKIRFKALHKTFAVELERIEDKMLKAQKGNLQWAAESEETKRHLYAAIDSLKRFLDNIQ